MYDFHAEEIKEKLKSRREDLPRAIKKYYTDLNKDIFLTGTNKSDLFEINRLNGGRVEVLISDIKKDGSKGETFFKRVLEPEIVKKVYCFGLDGQDKFEVNGDVEQSIKVRIIGGSDRDEIIDHSHVGGSGKLTQVYDSSAEDIITKSGETVVKKPSRSAQYDPYAFDYNWLIPKLTFRRSSGNGFGFGGGITYLIRGYNKPEFAKKWTLGGVYYPNLNAYRIDASYTFRHFIELSDFYLRSRYSSRYDRYPFYYGIGNNTTVDRRNRRRVNRIDYDYFDFEAGLSYTFAHKSSWNNSIIFEHHDVSNRGDVIAIDPSTQGFGDGSFIGLRSELKLDFTDNNLYPEDGSQLDLSLDVRTNTDGGISSNLNTRFSYFQTIDLGFKTTFNRFHSLQASQWRFWHFIT